MTRCMRLGRKPILVYTVFTIQQPSERVTGTSRWSRSRSMHTYVYFLTLGIGWAFLHLADGDGCLTRQGASDSGRGTRAEACRGACGIA